MEETKKSNHIVLKIVLILIVFAGGVGLGIYLDKETTKEKQTKKETKEEDKLVLTDDIKNKIEYFIEVATIPEVGYGTYNYFVNGANGLTNQVKYRMTNNILFQKEKDKVVQNVKLDESEINEMVGIKPDKNEPVSIVKIEDFNNSYKKLFNEEAKYELEDLKDAGCPLPWAINKERGKIYYFSRCGGTYTADYERKVNSIEIKDDYYCAHQEINVTNYGGTETKKILLLWKFDKNLNFVNTTLE